MILSKWTLPPVRSRTPFPSTPATCAYCIVTGGRNTGRVGTIMSRERHPGSFDIVHVKDASGHTFATRINYVFIIGIIDFLGGIPKKIKY